MKKLKILTLGKFIKKKINGKSIYSFLSKKKHFIRHFGEFESIRIKKGEKYDLVISYGYGIILKKNKIKKISSRIINLHIGYLPFARGIYPLLWSIIYNRPIGYTFHTIENEKIDTGKIILKKKIKFTLNKTLKGIHNECLKRINETFMNKFELLSSKFKKKKNINGKYYFTKFVSKNLLLALPKKWNTKVNYLKVNSLKLKKIYELGK